MPRPKPSYTEVETASRRDPRARFPAPAVAAITLVAAISLIALPANAKPGHGKPKPGRAAQGGHQKPAKHKFKPAKRKFQPAKRKFKPARVKQAKKKLGATRRPDRPRPNVVTRRPSPAAPVQPARVRSVLARARKRSRSAARPRSARRARRTASAPLRRRTRTAAPVAPAAAAAPPTEAASSRYLRVSQPVDEGSERGGPVRTVTKVIERVPGWLWALLAAIAGLCVAAFATSIAAGLRARRADRQRREVMENVGLLQAALLPSVPSKLAGLDLSVAYRPAAGLAAGGDFYDAVALRDGRVGLIIGDVSGHGRSSLAQTALVRFTVRAYLEAGLEPRDALKLSQSALEDKLGDEFVTVMLAVFDPGPSTLTYAGAGHAPPLLRGALPIPTVTAASAPLIGAGLGTGLRQTTVSLQADTTICLYTDGLTEAMLQDRMLGRDKLAGMLDGLGREATAEKLLARVVEETDRASDDMAVCLARAPAGAPTPYLLEELEASRRDVSQGVVQRFLAACDIRPADLNEAVAKARTVSEEYGAALLRVYRHEHPQRVEVTAAGVERLVADRR